MVQKTATEAILELKSANGTKAKEEVLHKYSNHRGFTKFLSYALDPLISYHLSEATLRKTSVKSMPRVWNFNDIFIYCRVLSEQRGVTEQMVNDVRCFLEEQNETEREIYIQLLSKTLRLGVTAKTINKIIPGTIPGWEVQQAYPIEKYPLNPDTEFWLTQKLNGVRATFFHGKFIARSGAIIDGLDHITNKLLLVNPQYVFDGELILKEKGSMSDNEAFRTATGILNSDSKSKTEIAFVIFDMVHQDEFMFDKQLTRYSARREKLNELSDLLGDCKFASVLPVLYHGTDQNMIDTLLERMVIEDKEGLMVNTNVPYKRSRHPGILKVKRFYTMDLPIIRCEEGSGRLKGTLGALVLEYKGNEVKVGSGFTDEQRKSYWADSEALKGMLCEVKYKEISYDKESRLESLQFPVFVTLRYDKTEVNYDG